MGPSDASWVWIVFYSFFIATLLASIVSIVESKTNRKKSIRILFITPTLFLVFLWNSFYRDMVTEFEYFFDGLMSLKVWAWFCILLFAYILKWWISVAIQIRRHFSRD